MTPQWNVNSGGTWGDDSKWLMGVPLAEDAPANFLSAISSPTTITVDGAGYTLGSMKFDNANRYTVNGPGVLTLQTFIGSATIEVDSGSHTINAPIALATNAVVNVIPPASTLTVSSDFSGGTFGLTKSGAGVLSMKNVRAGALNVTGGSLAIAPNGTSAGASRITGVTVATGAKLDLTNNPMAIDYTGASPATSIRSLLQSGYASGSWTGAGIVSSNAATIAANPSNAHKTAIGFAEASDIGSPGTWFGQNVDATSILMRYTYAGDANLDGTVGSGDFTRLAQSFNGSGALWSQGDFNFDGVVNALDFNLLASNFGQVMPAPALGTLVPEPGVSAIVALIALSRRRCKERSPAALP